MAQYYINLNDYPAGSAPAGWSFRQNNGGGSATILNSVSGNVLQTSSSASGTKVLAYNALNDIDDVEVLAKFRLSNDTGKQGIVSLRYGGTTEANTTGYTLSGSVIGGVGTLAVDEGGTGYLQWTNWNYLPNIDYWIRFRVVGSSIKAKVWTDGDSEPGWLLDFTDTHRTTGDYSGVHQYNTGNIVYKYISFGTNGDVPADTQPRIFQTGNASIYRPAMANGYLYRQQIIVPPDNVDGTTDLTDYPLLFKRTDNDYKSVANGGKVQNSSQLDIRFELPNGTKLDHSIERWNGTTGEVIAWVRIPTLSATSKTELYIYYGKNISTPETNPSGVWNSNYKAVLHLGQDPTAAAPQFTDETSNSNNGTGTSLTSGSTIEGKIGAAVTLDGSADYITVPNAASLQVTGALSVSFWFKSNRTADTFPKTNRENIVHKAYGGEWGNTYEVDGAMSYYHGTTGTDSGAPNSTYQGFSSDSRVRDNLWHQVQFVRDTTAGYIYTYIDGALAGSSSIVVGRSAGTQPMYIGKGYTSNFAGAVEEVRVVSAALSQSWVRTEYRNQNEPTQFFSVGLAETAYNNGYTYRRKASIDYTKVTASLTDFFFLFSVTNADFKSVANGGKIQYANSLLDMRFETAAGKKLSHEIDRYDPTTGAVTIWVKLPSVSNTANTDLYVYYGRSLTSSEENAYGTWNARSLVLNYHMGGVPDASITTGDQPDSSVTRQNGSGRGSMTSADRVNGKIGYAVDLDGNDVIDITQWTGEQANGNFKATRNMTLSAWIKPSSTATAAQSIFEFRSAAAAVAGFRVDNSSGVKLNLVKYGVIDQRVAATGITAGAWSHIAAVQSASGVTYYVNGASVGTFANTQDYKTDTVQLDIGGSSDLASGANYFTGQLDEVRMYQSQVSAAYIATEYNNQNNPGTFFSLGTEEIVGALQQTGDARIERVPTLDQQGNARISRTQHVDQSGNARIQRTESAAQIGNARIQRTEAITQQGNSRLERVNSVDQTGNAAIESFYFTTSVDQQGNARIQRTYNLDQNGNATIEKARSIEQFGNALIEKQHTITQAGDARIRRIESITQQGNAKIIRIDHLDQQGDARISRIVSIEIVGNAQISNPTPDKRPQQWQEVDTEQPAQWQSEDRAEQVWDQTADKVETPWQNSQETQEQQWSDPDNKQPTEWRRQFYD